MPLVSTAAIVLSSLRFSETSKIVRLATREHGVQSGIAKGALRPKSRFGGALQVLSEGQAQLLMKEGRELNILAGFDLRKLHVDLACDLERYAIASALSEVMLRFAPSDAHPESFDLFRDALDQLAGAAPEDSEALGFRLLWRLVSALGYAPALDACVVDGRPLEADGPLPFSTREGGALCASCSVQHGATRLAPRDRCDLLSLLDPDVALPILDGRHAAAHRRLLARYIRYHLGEGHSLPALEFWIQRPWAAA
jgi:DNA repair protein RecO (recombination protein O)